MIKALSAVIITAFVVAAMAMAPSFTPPVKAGVPQQPALKQQVPVRALDTVCARQNWPNIDVSCLRNGDAKAIQPARLVTAGRG